MHLFLWFAILINGITSVNGFAIGCNRQCAGELQLYQANCVCLPDYLVIACDTSDDPSCDRVLAAGFCDTTTYRVACAHGCKHCIKDFVSPPNNQSQKFLYEDMSAEELFDVDCGPPPALDHATPSYRGTTFTSIAEYICHDNYKLSGHGLIRCEADGIWSDSECTCILDRTCPQDEVLCDSGECMKVCPASSGSSTPPPDAFSCDTNFAIHDVQVCDQFPDCLDETDEMNCESRVCDYGCFRCDSGQCLPEMGPTVYCDGMPQCNDKSDEIGCDAS